MLLLIVISHLYNFANHSFTFLLKLLNPHFWSFQYFSLKAPFSLRNHTFINFKLKILIPQSDFSTKISLHTYTKISTFLLCNHIHLQCCFPCNRTSVIKLFIITAIQIPVIEQDTIGNFLRPIFPSSILKISCFLFFSH